MRSRLNAVQDWKLLASEAGYRPKELAKRCDVSLRQLERYFLERFGTTPQKWIDDLRLHDALSRLSRRPESVKTIAYSLQYKHPSNFSLAFKRKFGVSPRKYQA